MTHAVSEDTERILVVLFPNENRKTSPSTWSEKKMGFINFIQRNNFLHQNYKDDVVSEQRSVRESQEILNLSKHAKKKNNIFEKAIPILATDNSES